MQTKSDGSEDGAEVIELGGLKAEGHALAALKTAAELAPDGTINAGLLLRAIAMVARDIKTSEAFSFVASFMSAVESSEVSGQTVSKDLTYSPFRFTQDLAASYRIAERFFHNSSTIWGRDVVTLALLAYSDPSLAEIASQAGTTVEDLQDRWFEFVTSDSSHRSPEEWEAWWRAAEVPLPKERSQSTQTQTGETGPDALPFAATLSDFDHRNDWIGVRSDVQALSTLISVNRVHPPLSVAILGDWGSGKTFLMRKIMERVQILEQVGKQQETLAAVSAQDVSGNEDGEKPRYCSSILQIEFNAWHYAESNLWASLVNRIFEKLHDRLNPDRTDIEQVDIVERFFDTLETARAAQESARQEISLINAEIGAAEKAVDDANLEVDAAREKYVKAAGTNVWELLDEKLTKLTKEGRTTDLKNALARFGYEGVLDSSETIYDVVCRFRSVGGRAREVLGSLLATRRGVAGAAILAVLVAAATALAFRFQAPVLSLGTAFAGLLAWLAERAGSAARWLDEIESFDQAFSKLKLEQEAKKNEQITEARTELEKSAETLDFAKRRLGDAEARVARAKADLRKLTARDQMRRFVDERVTGHTYSQHLGLISMIRRDFEGLSDLMYRDRQPGESHLVQRIETEILEEIPTVERIILYIDDLDRCEPERVVEVLEAVHLLLAFRLFVVVVAVDPRWVLESLRIRYPHLARQRTTGLTWGPFGGKATVDNNSATTHDYLEKIFNIPFWVRPMNPTACERLISGYLGFEADRGEGASADETKTEEQYHDIFAEPVARESSITERPLIEEDGKPVGDELEPADAGTRRPSAATVARLGEERAIASREIASVEITPAEEAFIRKLSPFLGSSPRRIKRYANVYRLMKSGLTRSEARIFADPNASDDHRVVLVFLAIVTGAPTLAPAIFAKAFELRDNLDLDGLVAEAGVGEDAYDSSEALNARGALKLLTDVALTKDRIEAWVPRVMRYAFRLTPVDVRRVIPANETR